MLRPRVRLGDPVGRRGTGSTPARATRREAAAILDLIEHELAPRFYERSGGLPVAWLEMIRRTICGLAPQLLATRMLRDYVTQLYLPTRGRTRTRAVARTRSRPGLQSRPGSLD